MEGPQRGSYAARPRMQHLPAEQDRAHSSGRVTSATVDSRAEVGKYFHGLHYRVSQGTATRLLICHGRSVDQIFPFLCYLIRLFKIAGSQVFFQGGLQTTWVTQDYCQ